MSHSPLLRALGVSLVAVASSLSAQAAPNTSVPVMRLASALDGESREVPVTRSAMTVSIDREAFVLAYRRAARVACRIGLPDALASARKDAQAGLTSLNEPELGDVSRALDSAYTGLVHNGGCGPLIDPAKIVVVDGMEGHAWNTPLGQIGKTSQGQYTDNGYFALTRGTNMGGVKGEVTMTFTAAAGSERLIGGKYRFPVTAESCADAWTRIEREMSSRYASLRALRGQNSSCEDGARTTSFRNPDTDQLEVSMLVRKSWDGQTYVIVDFLGLPSGIR
jgi:hypothetical protein